MATHETRYEYRNEKGRLLYTVVRIEQPGKSKSFRYLDKRDQPVESLPQPLVLYRLPELLTALTSDLVVIAEGEKDVETLRNLGYAATTNPGGCRLGWFDSYSEYLRGRRVVILPDNDRPGQAHAERVLAKLTGLAASVTVFNLPRLRRAEDVTDWLERRGGTPAKLKELISRQCLTAAGVPMGPNRIKLRKAEKIELIFGSSISSNGRFVLLTIVERSEGEEQVSLTAQSLADDTGLHRVTVQRTLTSLQQQDIITRDNALRSINWPALAAFHRPPVATSAKDIGAKVRTRPSVVAGRKFDS